MASPLVDAIDALEYLLTARLMPEDYDVEELADALAHGEDGDLGVEVSCGVSWVDQERAYRPHMTRTVRF